MALNGAMLGKEIADAVMDAGATPEAKAAVTAMYVKIATAIVSHIAKNAVVPAGIAVSTTGTSTEQVGSTTASGKVQ